MKIPLLLPMVFAVVIVRAQEPAVQNKPVQESYPVLKFVTIQKDYFGDSDYKLHSKSKENLGEGTFSGARLRISAMIPVYSKGKLSMVAGAIYTRESNSYYQKTNESGDYYHKGELVRTDMDGLFSVIYNSTLFGKPLINRGTVILGSTNFFDVKKLSAMFSSSVMMTANAATVSTLGMMLSLDGSAIFPFIPVFSYWHKFSNSAWEMDAVLPQRVLLRRSGVLNGWLSTGIELNGTSFFVKNDVGNGRKNYEWLTNELYTNIGYEHLLGKNFLLGIKGGYRSSLSSRLVKVNETFKKYESRTGFGSSFFSMNASFVIPNSKLRK